MAGLVRGGAVRPSLVVAVAAALALAGVTPVFAQRQEPLPRDLEGVGIEERLGVAIPLDLEFTDESGGRVRLGDFFGRRPVVLTLNYYECPMLCTLQLNGLIEGIGQLPWTPGDEFEIVTVSINPLETPTLARLKKQAYLSELAKPGAASGWHFLVGSEANIRALADTVGFRYRYNEERREYVHAAGIMVATPSGILARYLYGVVYEPKSLRLAVLEAGEGKVGSAAEQFLLYCFHYDAEAGRYVVAASNVMRAAGGLTALVLGIWLATAWLRGSGQEGASGDGLPEAGKSG
ncbi:MAG: SCO family protein [Acidobacteriota bacterium]